MLRNTFLVLLSFIKIQHLPKFHDHNSNSPEFWLKSTKCSQVKFKTHMHTIFYTTTQHNSIFLQLNIMQSSLNFTIQKQSLPNLFHFSTRSLSDLIWYNWKNRCIFINKKSLIKYGNGTIAKKCVTCQTNMLKIKNTIKLYKIAKQWAAHTRLFWQIMIEDRYRVEKVSKEFFIYTYERPQTVNKRQMKTFKNILTDVTDKRNLSIKNIRSFNIRILRPKAVDLGSIIQYMYF